MRHTKQAVTRNHLRVSVKDLAGYLRFKGIAVPDDAEVLITTKIDSGYSCSQDASEMVDGMLFTWEDREERADG